MPPGRVHCSTGALYVRAVPSFPVVKVVALRTACGSGPRSMTATAKGTTCGGSS